MGNAGHWGGKGIIGLCFQRAGTRAQPPGPMRSPSQPQKSHKSISEAASLPAGLPWSWAGCFLSCTAPDSTHPSSSSFCCFCRSRFLSAFLGHQGLAPRPQPSLFNPSPAHRGTLDGVVVGSGKATGQEDGTGWLGFGKAGGRREKGASTESYSALPGHSSPPTPPTPPAHLLPGCLPQHLHSKLH